MPRNDNDDARRIKPWSDWRCYRSCGLGNSSAGARLSGPVEPGVFRGVGVPALGNRDCGRCVLQRCGCLSVGRARDRSLMSTRRDPEAARDSALCLADCAGRAWEWEWLTGARPGIWNPGFDSSGPWVSFESRGTQGGLEWAGPISTNFDPLLPALIAHSLVSARSRVSAQFRVCGVERRIPNTSQHVPTRPLDA